MFNVEVQMLISKKWYVSGNEGLDKPFATRKAALTAIEPEKGLIGYNKLKYRVVRVGAAKPHAKRFIIECFGLLTKKWRRSANRGLSQFFPTREAAQHALDSPAIGHKSGCVEYRVRQK
jgi:hypothetical protein